MKVVLVMYTKQKINHYSRFLNSIKSPHSRYTYDWELKYYMKDMRFDNVEEIITEDLLTNPEKVRELEDNLIDYISYLQKERKYSWSYIHGRLAAIFHFYTINRVNLNKAYISKFQEQHKVQRSI